MSGCTEDCLCGVKCKYIGGMRTYPLPFVTQRALDQISWHAAAPRSARSARGPEKGSTLQGVPGKLPELPQWQRSVLTTGPPRPKSSFPFGAGAVDALPGRSARATRALPGAIAQRPRRGACLPRRGRQLTGGGLLDAGSAGAVVCEGQALGGNT